MADAGFKTSPQVEGDPKTEAIPPSRMKAGGISKAVPTTPKRFRRQRRGG